MSTQQEEEETDKKMCAKLTFNWLLPSSIRLWFSLDILFLLYPLFFILFYHSCFRIFFQIVHYYPETFVQLKVSVPLLLLFCCSFVLSFILSFFNSSFCIVFSSNNNHHLTLNKVESFSSLLFKCLYNCTQRGTLPSHKSVRFGWTGFFNLIQLYTLKRSSIGWTNNN